MIKSFLHSIYQASGLAAVESPWVASLLLFFALWIVFAVLTALAAPLVRGIRSPSATLRAIVGTTVMALASLALVNVVGIQRLIREGSTTVEGSASYVLYEWLLYATTFGLAYLAFRLTFQWWIMPNNAFEIGRAKERRAAQRER